MNRRREAIAIVGAVVLVAAFVGLGVWYARTQTAPSGLAGSTLIELTGDSNDVSDSFYTRLGWQIVWETQGERFEVAIRGDVDVGTIITQDGPGTGITSPVPAGNFRLEITAQGPWSVTVIQGF